VLPPPAARADNLPPPNSLQNQVAKHGTAAGAAYVVPAAAVGFFPLKSEISHPVPHFKPPNMQTRHHVTTADHAGLQGLSRVDRDDDGRPEEAPRPGAAPGRLPGAAGMIRAAERRSVMVKGRAAP
jgi:hypothetical protein